MEDLLAVLEAKETFAREVNARARGFDVPDVEPIQRAIRDVFGAGSQIGFGSKQIITGGAEPYLAMASLLVLADRGPAATVDWLKKVHSISAAGEATVRLVVEVVGADAPEPIRFSNGVVVSRLDGLPPTPNVRALADSYGFSSSRMFFHRHRPMVAFYDQIFKASPGAVPDEPPQSPIDKALLGLSASGEIFPNPGYSWHDFADLDLEAAVVGRMWGGDQAGLPPVAKITKEAVAYAEKFIELKDDLARRSEIAALRLRSARSRRDHSQRAIDIAIALEALLLPKESSSELSHRMKTRASMLLGSTYEERKDVFKIIGGFYSIRSGVVHGAVVRPTSKDKEAIGQAQVLAEKLLRLEIDMGRTPDFASIDIGGPP